MRCLLVNLEESPENYHLEQAFLRSFNSGGGRLDVVHGFGNSYDFIGPAENKTGLRVHFAKELPPLRWDAAVFVDLPFKRAQALAYLRLLLKADARKKIFLANHLCAMPGQSRTADALRRTKLFSKLDEGWIFEFDYPPLWAELGLAESRRKKRPYCVDCRYYSPLKTPPGDYLFSAGSAGRDFVPLFEAVKKLPLSLKILTNTPLKIPPELAKKVSVSAFNSNLPNLKRLMAGSFMFVAPVADGHLNETAGMAMAFVAMAMKKPVLCRDTDWFRRYIKDGENGFLYGALSPGGILRCAGKLLRSGPETARLVGEKARRTMLKKASLDAFVSDFLGKI